MRHRCVILAVWLIMACAVRDGEAADWWGHKLPGMPTQFIFGYGSLIQTASRNATAGANVPAIPVRVSAGFGYIRTWNARSASGFTALGLRKAGPGETASTINGVLYAVDGDNMAKFDAREPGYVRVQVPQDDIEAVSWQSVPQQGFIWVYVPRQPGGPSGAVQSEPSVEFPLLESYIDVVLEGSLEYGPEFARELIETTADWSRYWLDDRELARRPWVHDKQSAAVDRLLASVSPAAARFKDRLFPVQYAMRWSGKSQ